MDLTSSSLYFQLAMILGALWAPCFVVSLGKTWQQFYISEITEKNDSFIIEEYDDNIQVILLFFVGTSVFLLKKDLVYGFVSLEWRRGIFSLSSSFTQNHV